MSISAFRLGFWIGCGVACGLFGSVFAVKAIDALLTAALR